jgi:hypothetical protein
VKTRRTRTIRSHPAPIFNRVASLHQIDELRGDADDRYYIWSYPNTKRRFRAKNYMYVYSYYWKENKFVEDY